MNKNTYLNAMGVDTWLERTVGDESDIIIAPSTPSPATSSHSSWTPLEKCIQARTKCDLHKTRTQTVFGTGNPNADLMFIGEAPGANEDIQGEPFVGRAGLLLNEMLASINLKREDVFIANILKCRPPNNRDPKPEETSECTPYLIQQISHIQPKIIVALGKIAAQFLIDTKTSLSRLRAQEHLYENTPLIATYHPAYLLRSPLEKLKTWDDLQRIKSYL